MIREEEENLYEYIYKAIQPGKYFLSLSKNVGDDFYNKEYAKIYHDSFSNFVEEVVVYCLCEVMCLGEDALENRKHYKESGDNEMMRR